MNEYEEHEHCTDQSLLAESSIHESELEYAHSGNIRASTYKRNGETEAQKK